MGRMGRMIGVVAMAGVVAGLGGCNKVSKSEYDLAMQENQELRDRLAAEQAARQEAQTRGASLEQENLNLLSDRQRAPGSSSGRTGFEGSGFENYRTAGGEIVVSAAGDVLFDSGKATLKASAKAGLDKVASVIKSQYNSNVIRVEGYTDTDPIVKSNWKSNERLSGERAMAVEEYLVSRGVPRDRIYYAGFGSAHPRSTKKDSRRVEIVILAAAN